ncbi:hypothetical protein QEG73_14660 [Chitinophagaceae bacterium 26-R-25]|nr:hypothetical protein [Chitinophagaceae bacterium 26-R-25]
MHWYLRYHTTGVVKEIRNQVLIAEKKAQANTFMRREGTASM